MDCKEEKGKPKQCTSENSNGISTPSEPKKRSIYGETWLRLIEVLFIAFASLGVSFMSYRTEKLEYDLNLENSKLHVEVYCDYKDTNDDERPDTSMLGVKYVNGIYENFDIDCFSVITFTYPGTIVDGEKKISIIIRDYFFTGYPRGNKDYFYVLESPDNYSQFSNLNKYLLGDQKEYPGAYVDLNHYAIISYKNIIGKTDHLGYECGSVGRFTRCDHKEIESYIKGLEVNGEITVADLKPETFMRIVKELIVNQEDSDGQL